MLCYVIDTSFNLVSDRLCKDTFERFISESISPLCPNVALMLFYCNFHKYKMCTLFNFGF